MTGLRTLARLRLERVKPGAVFVDLVQMATPLEAEKYALSHLGNVSVTVEDADRLSDFDWRPLTGLMVFLCDYAGRPARHRRLAQLIAEVEPGRLIFPTFDEFGVTVHQRFPDRSETYRA